MNANRILITTALWIAASFATAQAGVKKPEASAAVETLKDIQASAATVEDQANELLAVTGNMQASLDTHRLRLVALKDELNKAGQEIHLLENESPAPWERQALGKAVPLLSEAAANTQRAFDYFNENPNRLWTPDYHTYVERISTDSTEAAKILKDYLNYARSRDREGKMEQRIEGE